MYLTRPSLSLPKPPDAVFAQRTADRTVSAELRRAVRVYLGGDNPEDLDEEEDDG
jgi:hypothetical protein